MKCPKCGKDNSDDTLYCVECGTSLKEDKKSKNLKLTILFTAIIVIIIIAGTSFIIINNMNNSQSDTVTQSVSNSTSNVSIDSQSNNSVSCEPEVQHTYAPASDGSNIDGKSYSTYLDSSGNERIIGYDCILEPDNDGDGIRYFYLSDGSQIGVQA